MMNGEIGVNSELDNGSTFWFSLRFKLYRDTNSQLVYNSMMGTENEIPLVIDDPKKLTDLSIVVQTTEDRLKENEERKIKKKISDISLSNKNHHLHSTSYDVFRNEITDTPTAKVDQTGAKILLVEDNSLNQKVKIFLSRNSGIPFIASKLRCELNKISFFESKIYLVAF